MSEGPRKYASADMKMPPWPHATSVGEGRVETQWTMRLSPKLAQEDVTLLRERVKLTDPDIDMRAQIAGEHELHIVFGWENYDGNAMSRSSVVLQLVSELLGPMLDLEGRPPSDWPFLS